MSIPVQYSYILKKFLSINSQYKKYDLIVEFARGRI